MRHLRILFRLLSANRYCVVGTTLAVCGCVGFGLTLAAIALWPTVTPIVGVLMPLALPMVVVAGLILLAWGLLHRTRELAGGAAGIGKLPIAERVELLAQDLGAERKRTVIIPLAAAVLSVVAVLAAGSLKNMRYMDTPSFCGQACHAAMNPEWVAHQDSPHAAIACVKCHVGNGIGGFVEAKRAGTHDLVCILTGRYESPIAGPVHIMPPWQDTCGSCHWTGREYADKLVVRKHYLDDRENTAAYGVVNLKVGSDKPDAARGIHWHAATDTKVEYKSVDDEREKMLWVKVSRTDGTVDEYFRDDPYDDTGDLGEEGARALITRRMDCYDCHNRAAHRFSDIDEAVDLAIENGRLPRTLPFIKARAKKALGGEYETAAEMESGIANSVMDFYRSREPEIFAAKGPELISAVETLKAIYTRNVYPKMKVTWDTHPSHSGHPDRMEGCFRCHNQRMRTPDGRNVSQKCNLCHDMLADGELDSEVVKALSR